MGNAANMAKTKWNSAHYTQVKIAVDPKIATAFKSACAASGVSMAGELSRYMSQYGSIVKKTKSKPAYDASTRRQRRKIVATATQLMEQVLDGEICSHENVPENLQGASAYESAEESISVIENVIELLYEIY
ncbi:MAG: hypothetical protein FWG53_01715 [Clostridiales bacterium]|nr:hypothetical protein [Clostridiales bacterium]